MSEWPVVLESAPGDLVRTSGSEWLPVVSDLPVEYEGPAYLPHSLPGSINPRELIADTWGDVERAVAALSGLNKLTTTLPNPHLLVGPFRLREAQASSRIENTIASAEEIVLADVGEIARNESVEVRNYILAAEYGLQIDQPVSNNLIKMMHQCLMRGEVRGSDLRPGQYRISQAYISGEKRGFNNARFVPPPGEHVQSSMDTLFEFVQEKSTGFPAIVAAALTHYQFETIHPFSDGNGRLGRMLIQVQLNRAGFMERPIVDLSSFFDRFRQDYYDLLLDVSLKGTWKEWVSFFCRGLAHQAQDAEKRALELLDLRREYMERVTEPRASALLREFVDYLFTRPAVRTNDVAEHLHIQHNAAQRHVTRLVQKGILEEVTGRSSGRVYVAKEVIRIIEKNIN